MPLMTYQKYNGLKHSTPYTFTLNLGTNVLYYYGERHSYDPVHTQWDTEKVFWQSFLEKTTSSKRIVFVEGSKRTVESDEVQAILKDGGMGFITHLANKEGIDTYCPEPDRTFERTELLKQFSKEESQYYYFARVVGQWNRKQEPKQDFEIYMNGFLEKDKKDTGWTNFDFSIEKMQEIHKMLFDTDFDKNNLEFFDTICNPTKTDTVINRVARASVEIRDIHIVREIEKYMRDGYSVYIQFGATHAVMQEPLLRELLN
jgi:hypothetical protein